MDFDPKLLRSYMQYNVKICVELRRNHSFLSVILRTNVNLFSCNSCKSAMWYMKHQISSQNLVTILTSTAKLFFASQLWGKVRTFVLQTLTGKGTIVIFIAIHVHVGGCFGVYIVCHNILGLYTFKAINHAKYAWDRMYFYVWQDLYVACLNPPVIHVFCNPKRCVQHTRYVNTTLFIVQKNV